jgi:hypothetical protein
MNLAAKLSQLAGLGDIVNGIVGGLTDTIQNLINGYLSLLANWFYGIFLALATVLDVVQMLFRKMAGLEYLVINGQQTNQTRDLALEIISNQTIMNIFWSLVILAVVLLFITTFVAVIKSEYQPLEARGGNSKGKIIGKSLKSVVLMATVPVVAILGLFIGNALLKSLDMATSNSQDAKLSGRIFAAAAYEANRAREGVGSFEQAFLDSLQDENNFGLFISTTSGFIEKTVADKIDAAFQENTPTPGNENWVPGAAIVTTYPTNFTITKEENPTLNFVYNYIGEPEYPAKFSIYNFRLVWFYYDLNNFNFFVAMGVVIMLVGILLQVLLGLIKRLYSLTMLLVVVPPIIALAPVNEEAFKKWKGEFIKNALTAYSVVVVMNLYIMLIPVLATIQFFVPTDATSGLLASDTSLQVLNLLAQLLILIGGAVFFKDFSAGLAGMIGADDALKEGAGKSKDFIGAASKAATMATGIGGTAMLLNKAAMSPLTGGEKAIRSFRKEYKNQEAQGWSSYHAAANAFKKTAGDGARKGWGTIKNAPTTLKDATERFTESQFYKKSGLETLFTPNAKGLKEKAAKREEGTLRKLQIADLQARKAERDKANNTTSSNETTTATPTEAEGNKAAAASTSMITNEEKSNYLGNLEQELNVNATSIEQKEKEIAHIESLKKEYRSSADGTNAKALKGKKAELNKLKKEKRKKEKELQEKTENLEKLNESLVKNNISTSDIIENKKKVIDTLDKKIIDIANEIYKKKQ